MTRILHLSDLHFGFHRPELIDALLGCINSLAADLVVVTGDLTHRGKPEQYDMAAAFLDRIAEPVMAVPGNHDVPLYNMPARFLRPYTRYRRAIGPDLAPMRIVGQVRVLGLNSVDPFAWQRGMIRPHDVDDIARRVDPLATNIVALHHPLQHTPGIDKELARHAPQALQSFEQAGAHIALSGHLHIWACEALRVNRPHPRLLQIQGGTALCARPGDLQNEFALLTIDGLDLTIARHIAPMTQTGFQPPVLQRYSRADGSWRKTGNEVSAAPADAARRD